MSEVPLRSDLDRMVDRYLGELARALQRLPVSERDHLLGEIREHIAELRAERAPRDAWDMEALINRVGLPEDIASAALEDIDDVVEAAPLPALAPVAAAGMAPPAQPWFRRSRLLVGLAAAAVVLVLVVAVGVVATRHGDVVGSGTGPTSVAPATGAIRPPAPSRATVPNIIGMSVVQAMAVLQAGDLSAASVSASSNALPAGEVFSQSPAGGSFVVPGSTVSIEVSSGPGS